MNAKHNNRVNIWVDYADNSSILPSQLYMDTDSIAEIVASSGCLKKKDAIDYVYMHARRYTVMENKNQMWISFENCVSLFEQMERKLSGGDSYISKLCSFKKRTEAFTNYLEALKEYRTMQYRTIKDLTVNYNTGLM